MPAPDPSGADEPLATLNPSRMTLFASDAMWGHFQRLRREAPVHYTPESSYGPFWSVVKYHDIMAIDTNHAVFSSASGINLVPKREHIQPFPMFIAMDPPRHGEQRKTVMPAVAPGNLAELHPLIRQRAGAILDGLPIGEEFDWVDKVSKELTAMTLATLFGVPQVDRRRLTRWSDVFTAVPGRGVVETADQQQAEMAECFSYFTDLWHARRRSAPGNDLVSMLAHGTATREIPEREYHGNVILLIVGGNDTTRNSITGSVYALNKFPAQFAKLRNNPGLVGAMTAETLRWQTPLAHMMRTAASDIDFRGKTIRKGDQVVMWYLSGNRDEAIFPDGDAFDIERVNARNHLSFGFGIHRCLGNRLAELQLKVIWEEILARFPEIVVIAEPKRTYSNFVRGYESMRVVIPRRQEPRV